MNLSLKKSPQVQQVRYQYQVPDIAFYLAAQNLDWNVTLESGRERDRTEVNNNRTYHLDENQVNSLKLSKSFVTGTDATIEATTENIKSRSVLYVGSQTLQSNSYLLTLEQNLWRNSFGSGLRDQIKSARKAADINVMERSEAIEATVLRGGQLFWNAATLERRYRESEAVLKRYETLVRSVERKNRNKYAAPGEYAQVQAQYYARQQQARLNKINFEQALSDLKLFLPDITSADLKWKAEDPKYFSIIKATKPDLAQTRKHRLAELRKEQSELNADSVESLNRANFSLVGKVGATGIDSSATAAEKQWLEGRRPSLYMGIKWSHTFGSGSRDAQVRSAKAQAMAQDIATQNEKQRLATQADLLAQEIISREENLKSQDSQLQALRQAVAELTRNYNQGRIDINVLIDLINQAETAEASNVEARAGLELKFLEWQFLFDRIAID